MAFLSSLPRCGNVRLSERTRMAMDRRNYERTLVDECLTLKMGLTFGPVLAALYPSTKRVFGELRRCTPAKETRRS